MPTRGAPRSVAGRRRRCRRRRGTPSRTAARRGTSSCIRLRIRRNVDLPQPDGPISAVTRVRRHRGSTPARAPCGRRTRRCTSSDTKSWAVRRAAGREPAGSSSVGGRCARSSSCSCAPRPISRAIVNSDQHHHHQHQAPGPGPGLDVGLRALGDLLVDEERQRGLRAAERVRVHQRGAERGGDQRRRLADGAGDAEDHGRDQAAAGGRQHDAPGRPPLACAPMRERRLAQAVGHQPQHLLGGAGDDRQHRDRERQATRRSPRSRTR